MAAANFMNLSNSVGKTAMTVGQRFGYFGLPVGLAANLDETAVATAVVKDQSGQVIREISLGSLPKGMNEFYWDGYRQDGEPAFDGVYNIELRATNGQGNPVRAQTFVGAMVTSLGLEGTDLRVGLSDGRTISSAEIVKWLAY